MSEESRTCGSVVMAEGLLVMVEVGAAGIEGETVSPFISFMSMLRRG